MILLDTDMMSLFASGHPAVVARVRTATEPVATTIVTRIEILRGLTSDGWFEYHGEIFDVPAVKMTPVPSHPVPILIGGHAEAALKRAARLGTQVSGF